MSGTEAKRKKHYRKPRELYWSARMGLTHWTQDDINEVNARKAEVLAKKLAEPTVICEVPLTRLGRLAMQVPSGARLNGITIAK